MSMRFQRIESQLKVEFPNLSVLDIVDESDQHSGRAGQESHFKVLLVSQSFEGMSRVQRQRRINELLSDEFNQGLHALSLRLLTETEYEKSKSEFETPDCHGGK